jgi:hypothetical protein
VKRRDVFGFASDEARREADLFFADLMGYRARPRLREDLGPEAFAEDAAEDRTRTDLRGSVIDRARGTSRKTFLSEPELTQAVDGRASRAELAQIFDTGVGAAAPSRRRYDASGASSDAALVMYWGVVDAFAQRIVDLLERDRFRCATASNALVVDGDAVDGMRSTWTRSGEALTVGALCRGAAPASCPSQSAPLHNPTGATGSLAAHFTDLGQGTIRTVELAGLWGVDLRTTASSARPSTAVKTAPTAAPLQQLSFVAIRRGTNREIHVGKETPRRVESWVDNDPWLCLPVAGMAYRIFKRRFWEASFHRQWGTVGTISWIAGLANFVRERTGQMLGVGDVSHVVGEVITDHGSHRVGKDVDCYVLDPPPAGSNFPVGFWCSGTSAALELRELRAPGAADPQPEYGVPSGGAAIADPRRTALLDRYATILAYCIVTQARLTAAVWHGAPALSARALVLAQQAWDDTVAARAGTTASPGWRATWGSGPATRAEIVAPPASLFIGDGSSSYGAGAPWPLHQDHIHVRLR